MKSLTSVMTVILLLTTSAIYAQAARGSRAAKDAHENRITAQLNRQQLQLNGNMQQATAPSDARGSAGGGMGTMSMPAGGR